MCLSEVCSALDLGGSQLSRLQVEGKNKVSTVSLSSLAASGIVLLTRRQQAEDDSMATDGDKSTWAIAGTTLVGVGVGLIFLQTSALLFVSSVLIGIGVGLVITPLISRRR